MSESIKHECGIALIRLKKPLKFYKKKYGSLLYGINKMYLMMEKQHNRGQDGSGFASIKLDVDPGQRFISRVRSIEPQPIQDIFKQINSRIETVFEKNPKKLNNEEFIKSDIPYLGELMLGHVRYGTFGKNGIESVHPFLRQNNWMHRNLIVAGNFNMTNVSLLFKNLISLGQHPKEKADTITVMENIGHFLDDAVAKIYKNLKKEGYNKRDASPLIAERMKISKILRKAAKNWDGGYAIAGMLGHGDAFVLRDPSGIRPAFYCENDEIVVVASERPAIQTVFNIPYKNINSIGKQWIRRFALSLCKEILGHVRSKYATIPIPGESLTLNHSELLSQAKDEQQQLKDKLSEMLKEVEYKELVKYDSESAAVSYTHLTLPTNREV